jgi:metal-responsive CopG/Arc/MetJ family transcriptional regulator
MVVKINVSMPKEVLDKLDEAARETKSTRSALLSRAVNRFLEEREGERRRELRLQAAERIIKIAEKIGSWNGTAEILKWRTEH